MLGNLGKYGNFDFHFLGGGRAFKALRFSIAGKEGSLIKTYLALKERKMSIFSAT